MKRDYISQFVYWSSDIRAKSARGFHKCCDWNANKYECGKIVNVCVVLHTLHSLVAIGRCSWCITKTAQNHQCIGDNLFKCKFSAPTAISKCCLCETNKVQQKLMRRIKTFFVLCKSVKFILMFSCIVCDDPIPLFFIDFSRRRILIGRRFVFVLNDNDCILRRGGVSSSV